MTIVPSPNSLAASSQILEAAIQQLRERAQPIATRPDGRQQYQLPNGVRVVLSPRRQAKKLIMRTEGLSSRQYKKLRKKLKRERQAQLAQQEASPVSN